MNDINLIKNKLKEYHVNIKDAWLKATIDSIKQNFTSYFYFCLYLNRNINENVKLVVNYFINTDISLSSNPILTQVLNTQSNTKILTPLFLQINKIINVAQPVHSREEESNNRLLKLLLTDGTNLITAYEHSPIPYLNTTSPIGTKILIREGLYNYGYIELRPEYMYIIGGNNLKQPSSYIPDNNNNNNNNNKPNFPLSIKQEIKNEIPPPPPPPPPPLPPSSTATNANYNNSVVIDISPDLSQQNKQKTIENPIQEIKPLSRPIPSSNILFNSYSNNINNNNSLNYNSNSIKRSIEQQIQAINNKRAKTNNINNSSSSLYSSSSFPSISSSSSPFTTINEIITQSKSQNFYTMATLASVIPGFQFSKGVYELKGYIEDGSSRVEAKISNECLNDMFKITAEELMMIAKSGSSAKAKLQEITGNFSKILGKTEGMFEMSFDPNSNPQFVVLNVSKPSIEVMERFYESVLLNL